MLLKLFRKTERERSYQTVKLSIIWYQNMIKHTTKKKI
jgi:hypothetical protein